jgi:tetratricopeptide (TPR) repeat protein
MCQDVDTCTKPADFTHHKEALPLLLVLSERMSESFVVFRMLGNAQYISENYVEAAKAFDKALQLSPTSDLPLRRVLLFVSGDSWYAASNFDTAAARYEEALKLGPSKFDLELLSLRARSYRFAGQRSKALEGLLVAVATHNSNDNRYLLPELYDLLAALSPEDNINIERVTKAVRFLEEDLATGAKLPNNDVVNYVYAAQSPGLIESAKQSYSDRKFDEMDKALRILESFPVKFWPILPSRQQWMQRNDIDVTIFTLRAKWYREAKHEFTRAIVTLMQPPGAGGPVHTEIVNEREYELALNHIARARENPASRKIDLDAATEIANKLISTGDKELIDKANDLLTQIKKIM